MKKVFCAFLCFSLILLPCSVYAGTATGSAISLNDRLKLAELSGVATPSSAVLFAASTATEVTPSQFAAQYWYYNNSAVSNDSAGNYSNWNGLIAGISRSIARSIQGLVVNLSTMSTNEVNAITDVFNELVNIRGYVDSLESYTDGIEGSLTSIINSLGTSVGSTLSTISSRVNTTNSRLSTTNSTLGDILSAIENQSFTVPQQLLDDVSSIDSTTTTDSNRWSWNSTFNSNMTLRRYMQNGEGGSASDLTLNPSNRSLPNQIWYYLSSLNNSFVLASRDLTSSVGIANTQTYLDKDLNPIQMGRNSFWRDFRDIGGNINDFVARLAFVLANDEDIEARQAAQSNTEAVVDGFIKPSGSASASASDFGSVADIASAGRESLSSGVDPSVLLDQLGGDGDGWGWFSQSIQDELSAPSGRSSLRSNSKSNTSDTPYLDAYYRDLENKIGFKLW